MNSSWWYQLYLLQLENYDIKRYFELLRRRGWFVLSEFRPRLDLQWTLKLWMVFLTAFFGVLALSVFIVPSHASFEIELFWCFVALFIFLGLWPVFLAAAVVILSPLDKLIKFGILNKAQKKIKAAPSLLTIAVSGSYGKTTAKEAIAAAIEGKSVLKTPDNINTPLGIARLINNTDLEKYEVFIVEMGEYYPGDVAELAGLVSPKVFVVSGINEAHLERFEKLEFTVKTVFEGVVKAPDDAVVILNADDNLIVKHYQEYVGGKKVLWYSALGDKKCEFLASALEFGQNGEGLHFTIEQNGEMYGRASTKLLGRYAIAVYFLGLTVAKLLGVNIKTALAGLNNLPPIKHRLQPIDNGHGILVIDDSYNGNPAGAKEAIWVLKQFSKKRKIYLTPGLVEMGGKSDNVHKDLGKELAGAADLVILIKNSVTPALAQGLEAAGFAKSSILWFNSAPEAHDQLGQILKPNDVIVFQNDWGDNYV